MHTLTLLSHRSVHYGYKGEWPHYENELLLMRVFTKPTHTGRGRGVEREREPSCTQHYTVHYTPHSIHSFGSLTQHSRSLTSLDAEHCSCSYMCKLLIAYFSVIGSSLSSHILMVCSPLSFRFVLLQSVCKPNTRNVIQSGCIVHKMPVIGWCHSQCSCSVMRFNALNDSSLSRTFCHSRLACTLSVYSHPSPGAITWRSIFQR